jgi:hypothetical protein
LIARTWILEAQTQTTVCFVPQSLPLSWSVGLNPLDRDPPKRP